MTDATVTCWGIGATNGGSGAGAPFPLLVSGLTGVVQLTAGSDFTCVLLSDTTVKCWGYNDAGQLGDGTTTNRLTPTPVPGLSGVTEISAGTNHTCARLSNSTIQCWGQNWYGQLGDGSFTSRLSPVPTSLDTATSVSAGNDATCAVLADSTVACWGDNSNGQVGNGTSGNTVNVPTAVSQLTSATQVTVGQDHSCALLTDLGVRCWGATPVGDDTNTDRSNPVPVVLPL